jgi:hypothetical protein
MEVLAGFLLLAGVSVLLIGKSFFPRTLDSVKPS